MADRSVAPVIPPVRLSDREQSPHRPCGGATRRPPLPLPVLPTSRAGTMVYGLAALDSRTVIRALGWGPGTRLHIREGSGVIVRPVGPAGRFFLNMGASYSLSGLRGRHGAGTPCRYKPAAPRCQTQDAYEHQVSVR